MPKKQVYIVGGGIAGMMSALILERHDYQVTILEKSQQLGGRLAYRSNGKYKIDRGPTVMLLPHMHREVFSLAQLDFDQLAITRCDPAVTIDFADGEKFIKYSDHEQQKTYFAQHYPEDFVGFEHYLTDMRQLYQQGEKLLLTKPLPTIASIMNKPTLQLLKDMQLQQSTRHFLKNYFTNDHLLDAYSLQTLYIGGGPTVAPSLYALIGFSEHEHGVWYLQGGYAGLVEYLTKKLERRGVKIYYNQTVESVERRGKMIIKLHTATESFACDHVIFNAEYPKIAPILNQKNKGYTPSNGCVTIYLGLNRQYPQKAVHSFYLPKNFAILFAKLFKKQQLPQTPAIYVFNPSVIDDTLAPSGHSSLYILVPVPSQTATIDWDDTQFKHDFVQQILEQVEQAGFLGLQTAIEWQEVLTPADCEREGLYRGGSFGIAPNLWQSGPFRPQAAIQPFTNAYAVGASTHPGGGIPVVMQSAKIACEELLKKDGENANKASISRM